MPRVGGKMARREALWFYFLVSPWLVHFLVLSLGPIVASAVLSLTQYDIVNPPLFLGLANYRRMLVDDPLFLQSLKVTTIWVAAGLPLRLVVALLLAVLLNQRLPGVGVFRTLYYLPSVISGVAAAVVWMWLLQPQFGLLNYALRVVGLPTPDWLSSPSWALPGLIVMSLWSTGATMVIFLAGLQGIPSELYEAAAIDGAGRVRQFSAITVPMITPVILFNLIVGIISSFQVFTQAFIMTNGGPSNATLFYVLYLYRVAFQYSQMGYASAMAWVLFLIVLVLSLLVFRSSDRWVHYEGGVRGR
ncbi:MAG TPA: sugar ABC transporter permease [Chloroflexota bacterium]|nr:sugar ABC transporter permease [Chloroflexota bacterium]